MKHRQVLLLLVTILVFGGYGWIHALEKEKPGTTTCDLGAEMITYEITKQIDLETVRVKITGKVKNLGNIDFHCTGNQTIARLSEGFRTPENTFRVVLEKKIHSLGVNEFFLLEYERDWDIADLDKFDGQPYYRLEIKYSPDILQDNNTNNDDSVAKNNKRDRTSKELRRIWEANFKKGSGIDPQIIERVEVVAKRIPEEPFKTDRSVSILAKETIEEQPPRTVPEALFDAPGAFVQQTNAGGGSPIIRGMAGPQVLIAVDGIRFNNSLYRTGPVQYLNLIDPFSVDQIEVLRGPGSVMYGSDAMGGVIQLNSRSPQFSTANKNKSFNIGGNVLSRYQSSNKGNTIHGNVSAGYKDWSFVGGVSYKNFKDLRGGKGVGLQAYSGYDNISWMGKANHRFSKGFLKDWDFTLGYMYSFIDDAGRTDKLYDQYSLQIYDNKDHLVYGRLNTIFPSMSTKGNITVSYQDFFEIKDTHKVKNDYQTVTKTTRDKTGAGTLGLDLNMSTQIRQDVLHINWGGMYYKDFISAGRFTNTPGSGWLKVNDQDYPDGSTFANYGFYTLMEWDPVHSESGDIFRVSGGWRLHGVSALVPGRGNLPAVDFAFSGHVFLFSLQYLTSDVFNMSLSFSQGFRAPNMNESAMLGDTGQFFHIPNQALRPENSNTLEFMTRGRIGTFIISWTGYVSFLEDFIKRDVALWEGKNKIDGKDVVHNVNAGKGILWGTEGNFLLGIPGNWSFSGNLTYTWGEEKINNGKDVPLTRIPPLFGQLKIRYDIMKRGNFQGFIESYLRAAAKQTRLSAEDLKDSRIPKGGTPGWWTLNFRAGLSMWNHLRWNLSFENVFNKKYKYHGSGIYNPGSSLVLTLEVF